jgi:hypothetical protein
MVPNTAITLYTVHTIQHTHYNAQKLHDLPRILFATLLTFQNTFSHFTFQNFKLHFTFQNYMTYRVYYLLLYSHFRIHFHTSHFKISNHISKLHDIRRILFATHYSHFKMYTGGLHNGVNEVQSARQYGYTSTIWPATNTIYVVGYRVCVVGYRVYVVGYRVYVVGYTIEYV